MSTPIQRRVARALRRGGPDVIEVGTEDLVPLKAGEALIEVVAAGLNHAETLIRSGNYAVRLPFPHAVGGEGAGTIVSVGPEVSLAVGTRVCWGTVLGSCATHVIAPAFMLAPIPDGLSFEDGACLAVAGLTAGGLGARLAGGRPCRRRVGRGGRGGSNARGILSRSRSACHRYSERPACGRSTCRGRSARD